MSQPTIKALIDLHGELMKLDKLLQQQSTLATRITRQREKIDKVMNRPGLSLKDLTNQIAASMTDNPRK